MTDTMWKHDMTGRFLRFASAIQPHSGVAEWALKLNWAMLITSLSTSCTDAWEVI